MRTFFAGLLVACAPRVDPQVQDSASTTATPTSTTMSEPVPDRPVGLDPSDDLSGLSNLACATGTQCAPADQTWLGDTCCAFGEPMEIVSSTERFIEGVDIEAVDDLVVACGGFGPFIGTVQPDGAMEVAQPSAVRRCQRIAIGDADARGVRVIYFAQHGDTTLDPQLMMLGRASNGRLQNLGSFAEKDVLYEGLALIDGHLWVAAHAGGLRVYTLDAEGAPSFLTEVGGFDNAVKIAVHGDRAYVSDSADVKIVDASDPASPTLLGTVPTAGRARDIMADDGQVFVALGTSGVQVFDIDGDTLTLDQHIETDGSIQAVHARGNYVTMAAWDHLALFERDGLNRVGGIELKAQFEQTWGVAMTSDFVFATEWYGAHVIRIRPGFVAPELAVETEVVAFDADEKADTSVWVHNRGPLNLLLGEPSVPHDAFVASAPQPRLRPAERTNVSLGYTPPGPDPGVYPDLHLYTNDPGPTDNPALITISAQETGRFDVGDTLPEAFSFLDPTGADDLDNLRGKVTVLAYFALF